MAESLSCKTEEGFLSLTFPFTPRHIQNMQTELCHADTYIYLFTLLLKILPTPPSVNMSRACMFIADMPHGTRIYLSKR